jgi:hypothetical protein
MDSWDRTRLIGLRAKARLDAILADPEASKRMEKAVINGNALLSRLSKRKTIPECAENHGPASGNVE